MVEISRYSRLEDLPTGSESLTRLWADAFSGDRAADGRDISGDLAKHATRRDFQLLTATEPDLIGFIYGYSGERGQWWPEWVAAAVTADLAHSWLDEPHLELVELAVAPAAQVAASDEPSSKHSSPATPQVEHFSPRPRTTPWHVICTPPPAGICLRRTSAPAGASSATPAADRRDSSDPAYGTSYHGSTAASASESFPPHSDSSPSRQVGLPHLCASPSPS